MLVLFSWTGKSARGEVVCGVCRIAGSRWARGNTSSDLTVLLFRFKHWTSSSGLAALLAKPQSNHCHLLYTLKGPLFSQPLNICFYIGIRLMNIVLPQLKLRRVRHNCMKWAHECMPRERHIECNEKIKNKNRFLVPEQTGWCRLLKVSTKCREMLVVEGYCNAAVVDCSKLNCLKENLKLKYKNIKWAELNQGKTSNRKCIYFKTASSDWELLQMLFFHIIYIHVYLRSIHLMHKCTYIKKTSIFLRNTAALCIKVALRRRWFAVPVKGI